MSLAHDVKLPHEGEPAAAVQSLELSVRGAPARAQLRLRLTPAGLLAIGALVGGILLGSAVIVWTATSVVRRHPVAARVGRRLRR